MNVAPDSTLIIEGLVTTLNEDGTPRVSPMGPAVRGDYASLILRPFPTSGTCANLRRAREGVFHVTDDVDLLARAAVNRLVDLPALREADCVQGRLLVDACQAIEFQVIDLDDSGQRVVITCEVVQRHRFRDFLGFNRAKHAVVEAAILATRLHLLKRELVERDFARLGEIVGKTGGEQEQRAFLFLSEYVAEWPAE